MLAQPTNLPGNYQDNGTFLRAWSEKNVQKLAIPANAKSLSITFTFAKNPKYSQIPGNIQASVEGKALCNGRLMRDKAMQDYDNNTITYLFNKVFTSDKPNGSDWSSAIGHTLVIKAWIGESKNYITNIKIAYDL